MDDVDAYYRLLASGGYAATRATESPWSHEQQHGGPPLALAAYAMLRAHPSDDRRPASIALDFLGAIPRREVTLSTAVRRPGTRIDLLEARLEAEGRAFAEVRMWRVRRDASLAVPAVPDASDVACALPPEQAQRFFGETGAWGYGEAIEWRFLRGGMESLGAASVWTRVRGDLVAGEPIDPLARALVVADSANGVSAVLPMREWLFVPTGIVVTLRRDPIGEWIRLDAETIVGPDGRAICRAELHDRTGLFAAVDQTLFIARRT